MSMVLHENHLICHACVGIYLSKILYYLRKCEIMRFVSFLLLFSPGIGALVPMYHSSSDEELELRSSE